MIEVKKVKCLSELMIVNNENIVRDTSVFAAVVVKIMNTQMIEEEETK